MKKELKSKDMNECFSMFIQLLRQGWKGKKAVKIIAHRLRLKKKDVRFAINLYLLKMIEEYKLSGEITLPQELVNKPSIMDKEK